MCSVLCMRIAWGLRRNGTLLRSQGDNRGPQNVTDVLEDWAAMEKLFPGASVKAATVNDYVDALEAVSLAACSCLCCMVGLRVGTSSQLPPMLRECRSVTHSRWYTTRLETRGSTAALPTQRKPPCSVRCAAVVLQKHGPLLVERS